MSDTFFLPSRYLRVWKQHRFTPLQANWARMYLSLIHISFNFWIQLLPTGEFSCKMKLTIKAELKMFIKGMVKKPFQEGIEKIADALAMIPYQD